MAKDKKTVTNAMRLLNASKIKYETVEYEADEVGEHFGEAIAEMTGIPAEKSFKTLVARGDKTGIMVSCIAVNHEVDLKKLAKVSGNKKVCPKVLTQFRDSQALTLPFPAELSQPVV